MKIKIVSCLAAIAISGMAMLNIHGACAQGAIDNSALSSSEFREHKRTFGLVYTLPPEVNDLLARTIGGLLREKLLNAKLYDEAMRFNIPHVTVLHIHNPDPTTPDKMLKALPKLPAAAERKAQDLLHDRSRQGRGPSLVARPRDREGGREFRGDDGVQHRRHRRAHAVARGPLPRVTGPVYAVMGDAAKELVQTVGVSGLNVVKDGKELRPHNPHNTLVYSMAKFTPEIQAAFNQTAAEFNQILPDGIATSFKTVSIVELGFAGNVLREIYRISLEDGSVLDVATGAKVAK